MEGEEVNLTSTMMNTFPELLEVREDPQLLGPLLEGCCWGKSWMGNRFPFLAYHCVDWALRNETWSISANKVARLERFEQNICGFLHCWFSSPVEEGRFRSSRKQVQRVGDGNMINWIWMIDEMLSSFLLVPGWRLNSGNWSCVVGLALDFASPLDKLKIAPVKAWAWTVRRNLFQSGQDRTFFRLGAPVMWWNVNSSSRVLNSPPSRVDLSVSWW